jgi:hypothetical protein
MTFNSVEATNVFLMFCSRRTSAAENLRADFFLEDVAVLLVEDALAEGALVKGALAAEGCAAQAVIESWPTPTSSAAQQHIVNRRRATVINPENQRP